MTQIHYYATLLPKLTSMKFPHFTLAGPILLIPALLVFSKSDHDESESSAFVESGQASSSSSASSQNRTTAESGSIYASHRGTSEAQAEILEQISPLTLRQLSQKHKDQVAGYLQAIQTSERGELPWACFHPKTSPAVVEAYHQAEIIAGMHGSGDDEPRDDFAAARQFLPTPRWETTAIDGNNDTRGNPTTITWSIVPDGAIVRSGANANVGAPSNFRAWMGSIYGGGATGRAEDQQWFQLIQDGFDDLEEECGIDFVYEPADDGVEMLSGNRGIQNRRGDIRIGGALIDGDSNILAFAFAPNFGDVVFDTADNFVSQNTLNPNLFHNLLTHELGHALGLAHSCPRDQSKLMEPFILGNFRGPQFDTGYSLHSQYGDPLERHGNFTDNDSAETATPLSLVRDQTLTEINLSIDSRTDVDFFEFEASQFDLISIDANPNALRQRPYSEGPQLGDGSCSAGTIFNPNNKHNLRLAILGSDGTTSLISSNTTSIGSTESIVNFEIPETGTYYIRVRGSSSFETQRYGLSVTLGEPPLITRVELANFQQTEESGTSANGIADTGETIRLSIELDNIGVLAADQLTANLVSSSDVTIFSENVDFGNLAKGTSQTRDFLLSLNGDCGDRIALTLNLSDNRDYSESIPLEMEIGSFGPNSSFGSTNFDDSLELPNGWTTTSTTGQPAWVINSDNAISEPNAAFGAATSSTNESILMSPEIPVGPGFGNVTFTHNYDLENRWDGGVLEYSLNGGDWIDLLEDNDAIVRSGGYRTRMQSITQTALENRRAWTGSSLGNIETSVDLPLDWENGTVRFRWFMSHDVQNSRIGWSIDDITITTSVALCDAHVPELNFSLSGNQITEGEEGITVTVSTPLPLAQAVPFSLLPSGTAIAADFGEDLNQVFPAGETSFTFTLSANNDGQTEGDENAALAFDLSSETFATEDNSPVEITIIDGEPLSGFSAWANQFTITDPAADEDGDNLSNLAEYLLDLDPTEPSPAFNVSLQNENFVILTGALPVRDDATLGVESSADLRTWQTENHETTAEGLQLPRTGDARYYRLTFSLTSNE